MEITRPEFIIICLLSAFAGGWIVGGIWLIVILKRINESLLKMGKGEKEEKSDGQ